VTEQPKILLILSNLASIPSGSLSCCSTFLARAILSLLFLAIYLRKNGLITFLSVAVILLLLVNLFFSFLNAMYLYCMVGCCFVFLGVFFCF